MPIQQLQINTANPATKITKKVVILLSSNGDQQPIMQAIIAAIKNKQYTLDVTYQCDVGLELELTINLEKTPATESII